MPGSKMTPRTNQTRWQLPRDLQADSGYKEQLRFLL